MDGTTPKQGAQKTMSLWHVCRCSSFFSSQNCHTVERDNHRRNQRNKIVTAHFLNNLYVLYHYFIKLMKKTKEIKKGLHIDKNIQILLLYNSRYLEESSGLILKKVRRIISSPRMKILICGENRRTLRYIRLC